MIRDTQPIWHGISLTCVSLEYTSKPHDETLK